MWSPKQGLRSSPRGLSPGLLGCPPTWQLAPQGEQVGRERQKDRHHLRQSWKPFATFCLLEASH